MPDRHRLAVCAAALICAAAAPAAAHAATLTNAAGTLTYTAAAGTTSVVEFAHSTSPGDNTATVTRDTVSGDDDLITPTGCVANSATSFTCTDVVNVVADGGDRNDTLSTTDFKGTSTLTGGAGDDSLYAFDPATAAHTFNGGDGDDSMDVTYFLPSAAPDVFNGGAGIDSASIAFTLSAPDSTGPVDVAASLDGVANDGIAGQGANFGADVEDVSSFSSFAPTVGDPTYGKLTLSGSAAGNSVFGSSGIDTLDGLAGNDRLSSGAGNDTINARDGYADRVICDTGDADTALVDTLDQVSPTCENVQTADVGNANDDKPPTIAWTAPAAAAKLGAATTLTVNATDDRGVTQVQFLDDDRVVCTDTAAPYTCAYAARGDDVGRNTLVAIASDGSSQTASSVRTVTVDRFTPSSVSVTLKPSKDTRAPYRFKVSGKVTLPTGVSSSQGCTGVVAVTVKAGSKTISTRTDNVNRSCAYSLSVSFTSRSRFPSNGKLKVQATFRGNETLAARKSSTKTASTK